MARPALNYQSQSSSKRSILLSETVFSTGHGELRQKKSAEIGPAKDENDSRPDIHMADVTQSEFRNMPQRQRSKQAFAAATKSVRENTSNANSKLRKGESANEANLTFGLINHSQAGTRQRNRAGGIYSNSVSQVKLVTALHNSITSLKEHR